MNSRVTFNHPLTPPPSPLEVTTPPVLTRYKALFRESVLAKLERRKRKEPTCLQDIERIQMPAISFLRLDEVLNYEETDFGWPCISFNSKTCTGIVQWLPSEVHEAFINAFVESHDIAAQNLRSDVARRIDVVRSQRVDDFVGPYVGSKKKADVLFEYQNADYSLRYTAAVEIALSDTYDELVEDAKLWIEGNQDVRTVILIKVEETPRYSPPTSMLNGDEIVALDFPDRGNLCQSMVLPQDPNDSFGPLQLNGLIWVRKMSMFLEIWKRDETTGKATQQGPRMCFVPDSGIAELDLRLSDFFPLSVADGGDMKFPLTWDCLRRSVGRMRKELAVERCQDELGKRERRGDDVHNNPTNVGANSNMEVQLDALACKC